MIIVDQAWRVPHGCLSMLLGEPSFYVPAVSWFDIFRRRAYTSMNSGLDVDDIAI